MPGSGELVDMGVGVGTDMGLGGASENDGRKRKNYYIAYTLDSAGVYVGLETHLTTGTVCMLSMVVGDVCEGRQHVTRGHAAELLCAYRRSPASHQVVKVRGKDWVR